MFECCMNCVAPKRHPGCHSTCEEYKKGKEMLNRRNARIKKEKDRRNMINECEIAAKDKRLREKNHSGLRKKYRYEL